MPLPRSLPTGEGEIPSPVGNPLPRPHSLGAYGASMFAPLALMLIFSPSKPENQTPTMPIAPNSVSPNQGPSDCRTGFGDRESRLDKG